MTRPSTQEVGDANHASLAVYLERVGPKVPRRRNGDLDVAAMVRDAPLTHRRVLYDVDRNRDLLEAHLAKHGQEWKGETTTTTANGGEGYERPGATTTTESDARLKRQVGDLERRLAAAQGEAREVRQKLRRYEAIGIHLADTGRLPR